MGRQTNKNGGLDTREASRRWHDFFNEPGAIKDQLGPTEKDKDRVAIKLKDTVEFEDAWINAQAVVCQGPTVKKGTKEDVDKAVSDMQRGGFSMTGQSRASRDDMASAMARATSAAAASGTREGAFGSVGAGAAYVPDIKDLLPDDEVVDEAEDEAADGEVGAGENGPQGPKGKKKDELPWFNRDDRVGQ